MNALEIITAAYEACNRLSPGEALSADDAAFGLRRLNLLVDEMSSDNGFLFQNIIISATQTDHIVLGAGSWAAIAPGGEIVSAAADDVAMSPITMRQYNEMGATAVSGSPMFYAPDGLSTVFLYPVPTGQTIKLQTRVGVPEFADYETEYTVPSGYKSALAAALAVRIAPAIMGSIPNQLLRAESKLMAAINKYEPAIISVDSFTDLRYSGVSRFLSGY